MILCKKLDIDYKNLSYKKGRDIHPARSQMRSNIVFLVPTKNLLEQQASYFRKRLPRYFEVLGVKSSTEYSEGKRVFMNNERPIFAVMVHKVCLTLLRSGSMNIEEVDLIIFDECHHTQKDHPYNLIMREFYFYGLDFEKEEAERYSSRPFILGLTASPIKNKIKQSDRLEFRFEMMDQMKDLCSNMNSKIVTIDLDKVDSGLIRKLKTDFVQFQMNKYWQRLEFVPDPSKIIPSIREIIEDHEDKYNEEDYDNLMKSLDEFEKDIMSAVREKHSKMGFTSINPEKMTQVSSVQHQETLSKINFEDFPNEIKVALLVNIAVYVYLDNILINVGIQGLKFFIEDF